MKKTKFAAILGVAALALGACSGSDTGQNSDDSQPSVAPSSAQVDYRACLVSDTGGWDDKSFNQSAKEGLDRAIAELGVQSNTAESKDSSEFGDNVQAMVASDCDLTIGVGFLLAEGIVAGATENPDKNFALIDSTFQDPQGNERADANED